MQMMRSRLLGVVAGTMLVTALTACPDDPESDVPLKPSDAAVGDAARPDGGGLDAGSGSGGPTLDAAGIDASLDASIVDAASDASAPADAR
jgi:hypothetical protein